MVLIARRREAVNRWLIGVNGAVDEGGGDVPVVALEAREGSQGQNEAKGGAVDDGGKCLEVVLIVDLCVALADEAGSVFLELALLVSFVLVDPFTAHDFGVGGKVGLSNDVPAAQSTKFGHLKIHGGFPVICVGGGSGLLVGEWFAVHELDFLGSIVDRRVKCVGKGGADRSLIVERRFREDVLEIFVAEDFLVIVVVENGIGVGGVVVASDLAVMEAGR